MNSTDENMEHDENMEQGESMEQGEPVIRPDNPLIHVPTPELAPGLTSVHGHVLASGLHWVGLDDNGGRGSLRHRTVAFGRPTGYVAATFWSAAAHVQGGYVAAEQEIEVGHVSMAVILADAVLKAKEGATSGLIAVELSHKRFAMVAVIDGLIVNDSDHMGSSAEILHHFQQAISDRAELGADFDVVIAPRHIYPLARQTRSIDELVGAILAGNVGKGRKAKKQVLPGTIFPVVAGAGASKARAASMILALMVIGMCAGGYMYSRHLAALQQQADQWRKSHLLRKAVSLAKPPKPWVSLPAVSTLVAACSNELSKLPISAGGWSLTHVSCASGSLSGIYDRAATTTVAGFISEIHRQFGIWPQVDTNGQRGAINVSFPAPPADDSDAVSITEATTLLLSHFQSLDISPQITTVNESAHGVATEFARPDWETLNWSVTESGLVPLDTQHHTSQSLAHLDGPGIRVTSIDGDILATAPFISWTIKGAVYGY